MSQMTFVNKQNDYLKELEDMEDLLSGSDLEDETIW